MTSHRARLAAFALAPLILLPGLCLAAPASASAPAADEPQGRFLERKQEGWFWYKDPKEAEPKRPAAPRPAPPKEPAPPPKQQKLSPSPKPAPKDEPFSVVWLREQMPKLLDEAIDNPTKENVEAYLYAQRVAMDKSQRYAEAARSVVINDPFLDENNRVPLSTFAKPAFLKGVDAGRDEALKHLSEKAGIWVFFDSKCDFCKPQIYSVQELAKRHGFLVKYISMDGRGVDGLPEFVRDQGQAKLLGLTITPTTVLVSPPNGFFIVSQGMMAEGQLAERLVLAADSQGLLPESISAKVRMYDRGVLDTKDLKDGASNDPKQWVQNLKDRLKGRY